MAGWRTAPSYIAHWHIAARIRSASPFPTAAHTGQADRSHQGNQGVRRGQQRGARWRRAWWRARGGAHARALPARSYWSARSRCSHLYTTAIEIVDLILDTFTANLTRTRWQTPALPNLNYAFRLVHRYIRRNSCKIPCPLWQPYGRV